MADAMKGVTKALSSMNRTTKLPQINKIMMDFERESEMMEMKQDVMNDAMDDVMEDDEEESEEIVNQVLEEIGIQMNEALGVVPDGKVGVEVPADDLQARLDSLRKE
jgi:charged multivesicular body protein 2A